MNDFLKIGRYYIKKEEIIFIEQDTDEQKYYIYLKNDRLKIYGEIEETDKEFTYKKNILLICDLIDKEKSKCLELMNDFEFIDNTECQAYISAKECFNVLNRIIEQIKNIGG